jgi:dephospho-CoA kinase
VDRIGCEFGQHASEREMEELLNNNKYDYVIQNNGSIQDLFNHIKEITNDF